MLEQILDRAPLRVAPNTSILDAIVLMSQEEENSCVLVVNGARLVGIFTERDAIGLTASGIDLAGTEIARGMAQPVISLTLDEIQDPSIALSLMRQHRIRHLPVVDDLGELVGLTTLERIYEAIAPLERIEEISDRQQLEAELRRREQQFASLVENSPDIIFRLDLELRHTYISPRVTETSGLSTQDFLGKTGRELGLPAAACDVFEAACRDAIATGEVTRVEYAIADRHHVSRLIPERSASGAIESLMGITEDITERVRLEAQLQIYTVELEHLYNDAFCGYHSLDAEGRIVRINQTELTMLGYSREEIIGKKITDFYTPESLQTFQILYPTFMQRGWVKDLEFTIVRKDASLLPVSISATTVKDEAGNYLMSRSIMVDISDRQQVARNLAFLAEISQDLANWTSINATLQTIGAKIGAFLKVSRCYCSEIDEAADTALVAYDWHEEELQSLSSDRPYRLSDFLTEEFYREIRAGEIIVIRNTLADPRVNAESCAALGIHSSITSPYVRDGKQQFLLCITDSAPRDWRDDEIELLRELTARIWLRLERARDEASLAADLRDTQLLRNLSLRSIAETDIQVLYDEIVTTAIALMHSDAGSLQILDRSRNELQLQACQGFHPDAAAFWQRVGMETGSVCGVALERGERTIVPDLETCDFLAGTANLDYYRLCGIRAVQSCPSIARSGQLIGMFSTHWQESYQPSDRELRFLDLLARQAADLIEQRQAEEALRAIEEQRRLALDLTHTASWDWILTTGEVVWSDNMFRVLGLTPGAVSPTYTTWHDCVYPEDFERLEASIALHLQDGTLYSEEYRVLYPDGSIHWLLSRGRGVCDASGRAVRMVGITMDISDRKQLEIALQKSEELLRLTLDLNDIGAWEWYIATGAVTWNDYNYRLLGYQPGEVEPSYQLWRSHIHPDDVAEVEQKLALALMTQTDYEAEFRVVLLDGSIRWDLGKGRGIYDEAGQPTRMIGVVFDISDRKQAEQQIQEQAALLDIASDAIFVRDLEHRILYWNRGAERLYGWQAAEAMGQKAYELLQEDAARIAEIMQILFDRGEWRGESRKVTKTGKEVIVEGRWTLVWDKAGQPKSILNVNTDITEKKQLEVQFYRAQRLESIGTLASGIAHDFNNLLTPMLAVAELLPLKIPNLDNQTRKLLSMLEDSAKRGANLVQQVLSFSRGTEGKPVILQIGHLLSEVVNLAQSTFPKSIEISTAIPTRELWTISADATQIHQVLMNLLVNARDAMPDGGNLTIAVENRYLDEHYARMNLEARVGSYVAIAVSDTGTGIRPETIERIFDPFFTTKEVGRGTGLGLATVLGIVKNHGGFVRVSSEVGKGTQFQVFLPAAEGTPSQLTSEEERFGGNGELILIVDDEETIQEIIKTSLENSNYRTLLASDGIEAIALYAECKQEISVVLIDLMMPNLDGLTAIDTLQKINPQVKVIATSGLPVNESLGLPEEVKTFLPKPYTLDELLRALHNLIAATDSQVSPIVY